MEHTCVHQDKIIKMGEDLAEIKSDLKNAISNTSQHIIAGARYRLAIVCSCIGLVGLAVGAIVKFAVMDYKITKYDVDIREMRNQIYDLNYEKGREVGLAEYENELSKTR